MECSCLSPALSGILAAEVTCVVGEGHLVPASGTEAVVPSTASGLAIRPPLPAGRFPAASLAPSLPVCPPHGPCGCHAELLVLGCPRFLPTRKTHTCTSFSSS